jgi:DNA polymerase I
VAAGELETLSELVTKAMGAAFQMSVPLDVSLGTGRSWEEAGH